MEHQQILMVVAIVVFFLMLLGLILTVWEYRHHINPPTEPDNDKTNSNNK